MAASLLTPLSKMEKPPQDDAGTTRPVVPEAERLEAERLIAQGNARLEAGNSEAACILYADACLLDPSSVEAIYRMGLACWRRDVAQAEREADFALALDPSFWPASKLLSNALFAQGEYDLASSVLDKAVRVHREDRPIRAQIASVASAQWGLRQEKIELRGEPGRSELYLRDALMYDHQYATRYAMLAEDRFDPFLADIHHALARALQRRGKAGEARRHYRSACRIDPSIELDPVYREIMSDTDLQSQMPSDQSHPTLLIGHLARFEITKVFDERDAPRFDVEITLARDYWQPSPVTTLRLTGVRDLRFGDPHEGIVLGIVLCLEIRDVRAAQWDGAHYRVTNVEQGCPLSLYCRTFEVSGSEENQRQPGVPG